MMNTPKTFFRVIVFLIIMTLSIIYFTDLSLVTCKSFLKASAGTSVMINDGLSTIKPGSYLNKDSDDHVMIHGYKLEKDYFPTWFWNISLHELSKRLYAEKRLRAGKQKLFHLSSKTPGNWVKFQRHISLYSLYDPDDPAVDDLLHDMATLPIIRTAKQNEGVQLKVIATFEDGGRALLKPERRGHDNHYAEITAFHLDRILGYCRVPPTVGRIVNITSELAPVFPPDFKKTIYKSEDGRICFTGKCALTCKTNDPVCGTPDNIKVSLMHYLPQLPLVLNPWKCSYRHLSFNLTALCRCTKHGYESSNTFLMDTLDMVYFDMLIDNSDRHELGQYRKSTTQILFDNGKGFRRASSDRELDHFLHAQGGCCLIKKTTFLRFFKLYVGPEKLSELVRNSLRSDPLTPVLPEDMLLSLDRRLDKIMLFIIDCLEGGDIHNIIIDDTSAS